MKKCFRCNGTGKFIGVGFMMTKCALCDDGYVEDDEPTIEGINRKSKAYHKAIKDILEENPGMPRKEAIKMFEDAFVNS